MVENDKSGEMDGMRRPLLISFFINLRNEKVLLILSVWATIFPWSSTHSHSPKRSMQTASRVTREVSILRLTAGVHCIGDQGVSQISFANLCPAGLGTVAEAALRLNTIR